MFLAETRFENFIFSLCAFVFVPHERETTKITDSRFGFYDRKESKNERNWRLFVYFRYKSVFFGVKSFDPPDSTCRMTFAGLVSRNLKPDRHTRATINTNYQRQKHIF